MRCVCGDGSSEHNDDTPDSHCTAPGCKCKKFREANVSTPKPSTKVERLRLRVNDIVDQLERLVPDLPGRLVADADEALRHMRELKEEIK